MELLLARNWQLTEERWWSVLEPLDGAVRAAARRPWHFVRNRAGLVSVIDLHSDAIDLWPILPLDTVIWKRAVRVERDGVEFLVLGEEDRLIFLCWHFFQHSIVPGIPWEKLRDIQLVLRAGEGLDRAYLATRARQVGVTLFVRLACELARVVDPECTSAEWISTLPVAAPRRYAALRTLFLRRQDRMSHPERLVFWLLAHDRPLDMLPVWRDLIVPSRLRIGGQYLGHMPDWPEYLQTVWTLYSRRLRRLV
jgi:hypothetical protein